MSSDAAANPGSSCRASSRSASAAGPRTATRRGWVEVPQEVVAERDEIDEVIGMEVADDDRPEGARLERSGQVRERPLAEIEHDRVVAGPDEIGGADGARP